MPPYSDRANRALTDFAAALGTFTTVVSQTAADPPRLTSKVLGNLLKAAGRAADGSAEIKQSLMLIDVTALDIVDMQVRIQGETARLASALHELGDLVDSQHFVREAFGNELLPLRETAALVAAAIFPGAVQGLREVNVELWEFEKLQWKRYTDLLTQMVQRGKVPTDQHIRIQKIADRAWEAFADVNTLLNDLAEHRAADAASLQQRLKQAPVKLTRVLTDATDKLKQPNAKSLKMFAPVIKESAKVAESVAKLLKKLTIPIFPAHAKLGPCCDLIAIEAYENLSGAQAFALLNILARLQATNVNGKPMLTDRKALVKDVFPDRVYLEIDASLIDDLREDAKHPATASFVDAPASLHRFKDGSFKQKTFKKGNLQVSFATVSPGRVMIDADIDLYKHVVPHLFGEVLVNHMTGSTTDQFEVFAILAEQSIDAIGGFELLEV